MANTTRQTAAITGAGDGIGRALAVNLNERGIDLYLCDIDQERLDATVAMLDTARSSVSTALVDCGNRAEIETWAATITSENDRLDFLFNNAGVAYGAAFRDASLDNFEWLMNINYWGVVWCTKALLPLLEASPSGHLVNISSIFGMVALQRRVRITAPNLLSVVSLNHFRPSIAAPHSPSPVFTRGASLQILHCALEPTAKRQKRVQRSATNRSSKSREPLQPRPHK